jgi:cardiolipin synthase
MRTFIHMRLILAAVHILIQAALVFRILLRPHREPSSRIAWLVVVIAAPIIGIVSYLLLGEVNIGRKRVARSRAVRSRIPRISEIPGIDQPDLRPNISEQHAQLFRVAGSINGFQPIGGNSARIMPDSNAAIDSMVADMDLATDHVHLVFYIWLTDRNGRKMAEALMRAAARGVVCRVLVDDLGSRGLVHSDLWNQMRDAGVRLARSLTISTPLLKPLHGRIDLRDHRKILIVDDTITYCGSQNCADPEFRIKAKYAPWVDILLRFEGPVARQNQYLFAADWMTQVDDDIDQILRRPSPTFPPGFTAMAFGTGPTVRYSAMPEMFETLMYSARRELVVTTPYYVPTESMQEALCASARRGVATTIVFPARNDSWIVAAASRSYYADMLDAGVQIFEYVGGLLHAKTLTLDGEVSLIGSANMDRRSFELNFENNILLADTATTAAIRERQAQYISSAIAIARSSVDSWTIPRQLWNNSIAMLGPVL